MYLETNVDPVASEKAWQCHTYRPLHESERYKIDNIHELTGAKFGVAEVALRDRREFKDNILWIRWIYTGFVFIFTVLYVRLWY